MVTGETVILILSLVFAVNGFMLIGLLFYIGKTRIKEIDQTVLGYEFPHDSIFALIIRVPNYARGFIWKWSARRSGLEGKIEHFDTKFRWPFIVVMILNLIGFPSLVLATLLINLFGSEA